MKVSRLLMATAVACTALLCRSVGAEETPADRSTRILRSLDHVQEQLGKAREQIQRLEKELQALREELAASKVENEPVPYTRAESARVRSSVAGLPGAPDSVTGLGEQPTSPSVFRFRDPNFASAENEGGAVPSRPPSLGGDEGEYLLIIPPEGDRVVAIDSTRRRSLPFILSKDKSVRHRVTPIVALCIVGLAIEGPKISRLAVFTNDSPGKVPTWRTVELREPVDHAVPVVHDYGSVLYALGRRVYAYSKQAGRWDVLELPEGAEPQPGEPSSAGPTFVHNGHIYTFVNETGKWSDLDTRAILEQTPDLSK